MTKHTLEDRWSEISPVLDEAMELPVSARESWLADLEQRSPEQAAHVRSCLAQVAGGFSFWQMIQANEQRRLAEDQALRAEFARDFAEFVLTDAGATGRPFTTSELLLRAEQAIQNYGSPDSLLIYYAALGPDFRIL